MYLQYRKSSKDSQLDERVKMTESLASRVLPNSDTYLSGNVHRIIRVAGDVTDVPEVEPENVIDEDGCLVWEYIDRVLPAYTDDSYQYFIACVESIAPCMKCIKSHVEHMSKDEFKERYYKHLLWTSSPDVLLTCFEWTQTDTSLGPLQSILLSTAILERSLGDVYLRLAKPPCPSMLKDLLVTSQLLDVFGDVVIRWLRVMIGPPISLNIRNVTWHGFPSPGEIYPHYSYFILVILASIGKLLSHKNITHDKLRHREFVTFPQSIELQGIFPVLSDDSIAEVEMLVGESNFVPEQMRPVWKHALNKYRKNRNSECVAILLPQLEHAMRRAFAAVNDCEHRILTAENAVFFTTFDEILEQKVGQSLNKLRPMFGDSYLSMLFDVLLYPEGPRIRDRISHGEADFRDIPAVINNHVICVSAALCLKFLPDESVLLTIPFLSSINHTAETYRSQFHPISKLKKEVIDSVLSFDNWSDLSRPTAEEIKSTVLWENLPDSDLYQTRCFKCTEACLPTELKHIYSFVQPFGTNDCLVGIIGELDPVTLYRNESLQEHEEPNREEELVGLLRKITRGTTNVSNQIQSVVNTRHNQYEAKQLRSRQRNTYAKMLDSIPSLSSGLRLVMLLVSAQLVNIGHSTASNYQINRTTIRSMKNLLQYVENLLTYTHIDKNRWDEALSLTNSLYEKLSSTDRPSSSS